MSVRRGGSTLTVIGENLDSVATPQINVTVVIVEPGIDVKSNSYYQVYIPYYRLPILRITEISENCSCASNALENRNPKASLVIVKNLIVIVNS